ncbi:TIGR03086 family metal-binding protein [Kribbella sp. NBC_01245]|uniref:TIGR03086 family metal-binding protein n=1 Tax=Kribbella sp. NBC_01245 TaxID=2903578 RepID=UPI002E2A26D7|nr:TIGR03086 family metal-binding protein [Kribbella sp. NBC_01245]
MSKQADRFERVSADFLARVTAVPADRWDAPTPCPNWNVREVVAHVINEQRRILATVRKTEVKSLYGVRVAEMGVIPELEPDADLAAAWQEVADGLVVAIDDPACAEVAMPTLVGPLPFADVVEALPVDVLIHSWDLARGTGGDDQLDQEAVVHVFEKLKPLDDAMRQPWAFGPKLTPPLGADVQTEFLCFVGRRP